GRYYKTYSAAVAASGSSAYVTYLGTSTSTSTYSTAYSSSYPYYSSVTGRYYKTYSAAVAASGSSAYVTYVGSSASTASSSSGSSRYPYYSSYTGRYYASYAAALLASGGVPSYIVDYTSKYITSSSTSVYKYYYNGTYYGSLAEAKAAGGTAVGVDIFYTYYGDSTNTIKYYYYNGTYYGSLAAAKAAGGTALGDDIFYVPYGYYSSAMAAATTFTNAVTATYAESGSNIPFIYGKRARGGWNAIVYYIETAASGDTVKVNMNGATTIDLSALKALEGRDVTLECVLTSGVTWTINGKDITDSSSDMTIYTEYNISYVKNANSKLLSKAVDGAETYAEIGIGTDFSDMAAESVITVKFNESRAGLTAVAYRYDTESGTLKGVCKSTVQSDGSVSIKADQYGAYVIVLK
ncbi:MAG: hypothetical protein LIO69_01705, partial [Oscillospiraceae bacterium]|nr:hypothetical protein [Oscillospiraceae bacterium]